LQPNTLNEEASDIFDQDSNSTPRKLNCALYKPTKVHVYHNHSIDADAVDVAKVKGSIK